MVRRPRWEDAWKVIFVFVNLAALGLTAWAIESTSSWGYALDGLEAVFASLFATSLVVIGILGTLLYQAETEDNTDGEPQQRERKKSTKRAGNHGNLREPNESEPSNHEDNQQDSSGQLSDPGQSLTPEADAADPSGEPVTATDAASTNDHQQSLDNTDEREVDNEESTADDKIDPDLLTGDDSNGADDSGQLNSDGNEADREDGPLSEHTVRYRENRKPY